MKSGVLGRAGGGVCSVKAEDAVYSIDYSTKTGFPFYVMGYVPEWVGGIMTDLGGNYTYKTPAKAAEDGDDVSGAETVKTEDNTEYYRLPSTGTWHQYFIADGITTEIGGAYIVKAKVKASAAVTMNVNMGWGWGEGEKVTTSVTIPASGEFQDVEWEYSGIGGASCNLVAQPNTTATIEWKELAVYKKITSTSVSILNSENLINIPLEQDQEEGGGIHKASYTVSDGVTTYTTTDGICIIFKMLDVNVEDCDAIVYKFAEPIPAGIQYAVWSKSGNKCVALDAGITEFMYVFANDPDCAVSADVIPQVSLVTVYAQGGKTVKVKGVYKHKSGTGTRTYSFDKALDFTGTGVEAYVISAFDNSLGTLTLSRVYQVPANTGLYLFGNDGNYDIPTIASADAIASNLLKPSGDGTITATAGDYTNLVLSGSGASRGFHPLSGDGNMGENKAYLQLPTADYNTFAGSGAPLIFVYEDESTGISSATNNANGRMDNTYYDLQGRRVANPTRGLYIVNGKKVIVK